MFDNRLAAGTALALKVAETLKGDPHFSGEEAVVIGLPRGGVPVAAEVAKHLGCPLDILVSKKIPAPGNPELAIGAVTSSKTVVVDEQLAHYTGADRRYLEQHVDRLIQHTLALEEHWIKEAKLPDRPDLRGKTVIVVDDGIATGMTAKAALRSLRGRAARVLVLAVPVISGDALESFRSECDLVIALSVPGYFGSVGQYYRDFRQVDDDEVVAVLAQHGSARSGPAQQPSRR